MAYNEVPTMAVMILSVLAIVGCASGTATQPAHTITIDVSDQRPISPYIYGGNSPEWEKLKIPFPMARQGGNRMTAYNWENNASNAGSDWHHQNDAFMGASNVPGWTVKSFLDAAQANGAVPLLTVPMAGYVAADKAPEGDVNQTPDYINRRFKISKARKGSAFQYPPNGNDRFVYQDEFVHYIETIKKPGSEVWYALDNEPDIWASTHVRIVPKTPTYAQIIARSIEWASAIRDAAPKSLIFGPASYGWSGFRRFQDASDANNRDFLDVYLSAMRDAQQAKGKRLLDVLDLHWYPEARGDNTRVTERSASAGTVEARIQAPRSLWDPSYVENSWIADSIGKKPIALIPGIQGQIAANYPGTKLAFTEYNYGGGGDISGAIAQADVLGIFGRYGVFAAANWTPTLQDPSILAGYRAFLNFDGQGSRFGEIALRVIGEQAASESVYASRSKSTGALVTVVINKLSSSRAYRLAGAGVAGGKVAAFQLAGSDFSARPVNAQLNGNAVLITVPGRSVTTIQVKK